MPLFRKNIGRNGRIVRAIGSLALLAGAAMVWHAFPIGGVTLLVAGAFVAFEAARGWCALRACGLKTKF